MSWNIPFTPQPIRPPVSIAAARAGMRGMPIRADTLAAPPPIAKGCTSWRSPGVALPAQPRAGQDGQVPKGNDYHEFLDLPAPPG